MTPEKQKFYEDLSEAAIKQQIKYGIPASVTLAQAWIEHGSYSKTTKNYFGIHDDNGYWRNRGGQVAYLNDNGKMAYFRVYSSKEQGLEDHSQFFLVNRRYSSCLTISPQDPHYGEKWAKGICAAGYAERPKDDPDRYARQLIREIHDYGLGKYDKIACQRAAESGVAIGHLRGQAGISDKPSADYAATAATPSNGVSTAVAGGYAMPVAHDMVMTSGYGFRKAPTAGASTRHEGIDIAIDKEAVRATERGVVVAVKNDMTNHDSAAVRRADGNKGGNYAIVRYDRENGQSYYVSYCHLDENGVFVKKGDTVQAGQEIGRSGSTGNGTGPHLHITVRSGKTSDTVNGTVINPLLYLGEISARGHLQHTVVANGRDKDLLATYRSTADVTLTPADRLLLAQSNAPVQPSSGDALLRQQDIDPAILAQCGQFTDPLQMLSYMMQQQNLQGPSGGLLSGIISSLFSSAMMLAFKLQYGNGQQSSAQQEEDAAADAALTPEQQHSEAIHRRRETPDADKARQMASMNFDVESPEQQSNGNTVRLT